MISSPTERRIACFVYDLATEAEIPAAWLDRYESAVVTHTREALLERNIDIEGFLYRWDMAYNPPKKQPESYAPSEAVRAAAAKFYALVGSTTDKTQIEKLVATKIDAVVDCAEDPTIRAALGFVRTMFGYLYNAKAPAKYRARAVFHAINAVFNIRVPTYLCDAQALLTNPSSVKTDAATNKLLWITVFQTDIFNGFHYVDVSARNILRMPERYKDYIASIRSEV
jgi:hypothetical protein